MFTIFSPIYSHIFPHFLAQSLGIHMFIFIYLHVNHVISMLHPFYIHPMSMLYPFKIHLPSGKLT